MSEDLSFVTDDELTEELQKRYEAVIIAVTRKSRDGGSAYNTVWWYKGSRAACIGLAEMTKDRLLNHKESEDDDDVPDDER